MSNETAPGSGQELGPEEERARRHIAAAAEAHRRGRGTIEAVSLPRTRKLGRRIRLAGVWIGGILGAVWRRLSDSHRIPGRWLRRVFLFRPEQLISGWVLFWIAIAAICVAFLLAADWDQPADTLFGSGLGGALAAVLSIVWHDLIKSPHTARRARHRIIKKPEVLLQPTLAEPLEGTVELEPPVEAVPRDDLYDELLPGVITRSKEVQILVGGPGAGKTTALIDLAKVLARIGLVPVLVELRDERTGEDLFALAKKRFEKQVRPLVKTSGEADVVWRWLCRRRRVAILVDDIDQIGFDGEPGFVMRHLLEDAAGEGQAVIATARPAGVPAGIAASAITLQPLGFATAVDIVAKPVVDEPSAGATEPPPRGRIERWIEGGELTKAPLYLEALAELTAAGACPDLPGDPKRWADDSRLGRRRKVAEDRWEWNPLWVRYLLLDCFHEKILDGRVRSSQAISTEDRKRSVRALEGAALGMLGATGIEATAAVEHGDQPEERRDGRPKRAKLVDFLTADDRRGMEREGDGGRPRPEVSQHEAIDAGERLRILDRDADGQPQFRHRIMQAFLAGRCLAKLGQQEGRPEVEGRGCFRRLTRPGAADGDECTPAGFSQWLDWLMDRHHPEKLTAHLTLTFAAIHADDRSLKSKADWDWIGGAIVGCLVEAVKESAESQRSASAGDGTESPEDIDPRRLDPTTLPDLGKRNDPDDSLIKLTTAANVVAVLRPEGRSARVERQVEEVVDQLRVTNGAMSWTKLEAVTAIAALNERRSWQAIWKRFASDTDYEVRRAASRQLELSACCAYPLLKDGIDEEIWRAGRRAADGEPVQSAGEGGGRRERVLTALGWILPAMVSGLSEGLPAEVGPADVLVSKPDDGHTATAGKLKSQKDLQHARLQLERLTTLAHEGSRHRLEESLAQGFKADAMHHASEPRRRFSGAGWVACNRRLVADVALPHAESWYARMLLYQALAMYSISGIGHDDTFDVIAYRLRPTRERHPFVKRAMGLSRAALYRGKLRRTRWKAFIWGDDVEDADRLPALLGRRATRLVGDVALLVALKEGSPVHRHGNFGHMEQLPYCLSASKNRHEILGNGCPAHCGWGFCPYRASSPDEPEGHRGIGRGFSRSQRRLAPRQGRPPWQRRISRKRLQEFWRHMEYKARR